jgi:hypothetical protein
MKKHLWLTCLLIATIGIHAQNLAVISDCVTNPPSFMKMSYQEADEASFLESDLIERGARKICPEYITNLVNQLYSGRLNHDNEALAIDLLGALHPGDLRSIEFLIQNIDFERTKFDPPDRISTQSKYPAAEALVKIGQPVVIPILNRLPSETNLLRRQLMCDVLKRVWQRK